MRKLFLFCAMIMLVLASAPEAEAQLFGKKKRNSASRRASRYSGARVPFSNQMKYFGVGFSVSAFNYFGDLSPIGNASVQNVSFTRPGFGIHAFQRINSLMFVRANFNVGLLEADDAVNADINDIEARYRYARNLQFRNWVKELSFDVTVDLFGHLGRYRDRVPFTPYFSAGVGIFHHNPQGLVPEFDLNGNPLPNAGNWVDLQPLGTSGQNVGFDGLEPYSRIGISIPVGVGVRARLTQGLDFWFEVTYHHTFTDFLDDAGATYADLGAFGNDELARALSDRSNEATAVGSGQPRDLETVGSFLNTQTYTSAIDGQSYTVFGGYGRPGPGNFRGNPDQPDVFILTSMRISYIFGSGSLFGKNTAGGGRRFR